jgi:hypothetical protein
MSGDRGTALPPLLRRDPTHEEQLRQLWSMTAKQRLTAYRAGRLTNRQASSWASRRPREVPRLNGEFEFIAIYTPEVAEAAE